MFKGKIKGILVMAPALVLLTTLSIAALAAGGAIQITATLDPGVTITYNAAPQSMVDANGNPVYPIMYNDTTYLPVRAVSNMLGVAVDWDNNTRTVKLGNPSAEKTKLSDLSALSRSNTFTSVENVTTSSEDIFGNRYSHGLIFSNNGVASGSEARITYLISGKYKLLTGILAPSASYEDPAVLKIYSVSDEATKLLYESKPISLTTEPFPISVDITNVNTLLIVCKVGHRVILGNAFVE